VRAKTGPLDLVTDADEAAERVIEAALLRAFPGCAIVGEEAASADESVLKRLKGAELAFVIDPVDGTANYAAGLPLFGCMAAAVVRGEVALAVIHDPLGDDSAIAVRGEGAFTLAADGQEATMQGVDLDKESGKERKKKEWEDMKARVFSGGQTEDANDVLSLQGPKAKQLGFGIGLGLDYEDDRDPSVML
jgi:fructose-1,6-bisphosphatase/inositol monophosphatase family enzyme